MAEQVARPRVILDDKEVKSKLDSLRAKSEEIKKTLQYAITFNADFTVVNDLKKQLGGVNNEMRQLQKQAIDVNKVLSNLSGSSIDELVKARQKLEGSLKKTARDSPEWDELNGKIKLVKTEIQKVNQELAVQNTAKRGWVSKANGFISEYGMIAAGAIASFTGLTMAVGKYSDKVRELEDRKLNLQSMTGLKGNEADYFEEQARTLSTSKTKEGVRITSEAQDIIDAYTLMGSKRPELLKSKEDLAAVTREALILGAASKDSAQAATEAVAMAMNQFGASANEAARYVNVLAAGSQAGAVAVPMITESLAKMGPAAKNVGMNIEQTVAMIETLGEKGIEGAEAGTQLKGVLLTLATGADETNPKIVGMQKAFENLAAKNMSATQMVKMFGKENYTAAAIMLDSVPKLKQYETAVTGTNTAYQQAITNTSGAKATLAQARNEFTLNAMTLAQKLEPAIRTVTVSASGMLKIMMNLPEILKVMTPAIVGLTAAWVMYQLAQEKEILLAKANILWNNALITSFKKLYATIAANPYAAIVAGAGLAITAIIGVSRYLKDQRYAFDSASSATETFTTKLSAAKTEANAEFEALSKTTQGTHARKAAIHQLNEKYGSYLSNMLTEKSTLADIRKAQDEVINGLTKRIFLQSKEDEIAKAGEQYLSRNKDTSSYLLKQVQKVAKNNGSIYAETLYNTILDEINNNPNKSIGGIFQNIYKKYPNLKPTGSAQIQRKNAEGAMEMIENNSPQWNIYKQAAQILNDQKTYKHIVDGIGKQFDGIAKSMKIVMDDKDLNSGSTSDSETDIENSNEPNNTADDKFSKEQEALEKWVREKENIYKQQYLDQKIDKIKFDEEMYALEVTRLMKLKALELKFKKDITTIEGQILDKRIAQFEHANSAQLKDRKEFDAKYGRAIKSSATAESAMQKINLQSLQARRDAANKKELEKERIAGEERKEQLESDMQYKKDKLDQFNGITQEFAANFGQLMADYMTDVTMRQEDFAAGMLNISLDMLHNIITLAIAEITAREIASKGWIGIVTGAALTTVVEAAFGVAKSLVKKPTAQREFGKYDVLATDGNTYNAQVNANPATGIYSTPTLFAEKGDELIVDGKTLRRIQMRSPWLVNQIMEHRVPQRAEGKYDATSISVNKNSGKTDALMILISKQSSVIEKLSRRLDEPIEAQVISTNYRTVKEREDAIRGKSKRG